MKQSFSYLMMYAPARELVGAAAGAGMNWAVVESCGHKNLWRQKLDDIYAPFDSYPKLKAAQKIYRPYHRRRIARARELMEYARSLGLKTAIHCYEIALPKAVIGAYPEVTAGPVRDGIEGFYTFAPYQEGQRCLCLSNPKLRELITAKVRETCRLFPQMDGYIYSNHETMGGGFAHRCPYCRAIPYWQMFKLLHDAIREGLDQANPEIRLFIRCWGAQESTRTRRGQYLEWFKSGLIPLAYKKHWEKMVRKYGLYTPEDVIPKFVRSLKGTETAFIYKATWADIALRHPMNPWLGKYKPQDEIVEVSFEFCRHGPDHFAVLSRQIPAYIEAAARKKLAGVCAVPVNWSATTLTDPGYQFDPEAWKLNRLNLDLFAACAGEPGLAARAFVRKWLKKRYGTAGPAQLAQALLKLENISSRAYNLNGVSAQDGYGILAPSYVSLNYLKHIIFRYAFLRRDGLARVSRAARNLERMFAKNDSALREAAGSLRDLAACEKRLPARMRQDFRECFSNWFDLLRFAAWSRRMAMLLWSMEAGKIKAGPATSQKLWGLHEQICKLAAGSAMVRRMMAGY